VPPVSVGGVALSAGLKTRGHVAANRGHVAAIGGDANCRRVGRYVAAGLLSRRPVGDAAAT
jgi:hypothetical protein